MSLEYYNKLSIIALGETGSGKSLFCKLFSKNKNFFSMKSGTSVTRDIIFKTFRNDIKRVEIELIDTPGYNDTDGDAQDINNLNMIKNFLSQHDQRINCVIIVMNANVERIPNSIQKMIKNICTLFPLPDFWNHVIIFWTHWSFQFSEDEENKKQFIQNIILPKFKELSQNIFNELRITPIQNDLKMIFNEYAEDTTNQQRIQRNKENSERNFEKIIDFVKNMKPIYDTILPPDNKIELQEPVNGTAFPNYIQFKYKKLIIRKYKDFHSDAIIEKPETLLTFYVHEFETDWEICETESNQTVKKYKKYKKRIFLNEENQEFNPENQIDIPVKEIKREKTVERKTEERLVVGNPKRKKIFEYDEVKYSDLNEPQKENIQLMKEIEEGETDWINDTNFNVPNTIRNVKYKTIKEYDSNGAQINNQTTDVVTDWEKIETRIENDIPQRIDENITNYIKKITILKATKNCPNPIEIPGGSSTITRTEIFKNEFDPPVRNLDRNNIGEIKYNCYRVKYINNVRQSTPKTLIPGESYILYYKKDDKPKTKIETRNDIEYEIKYNEIYMVDSRDLNNRHPTNFTFILNEEQINIITKIELKETYEGKIVKKQNYKLYFRLDQNRKEIFLKEEPIGKVDEQKIEFDKEYFIIESPMSLDKINQMRSQKNYPIIYNRIYYKNEKNTLRKNKVPTGKIEKVELKLEKMDKKEISKDNKIITFITEFKEIMFINDEKYENNEDNIIDIITKTYELTIKSEEEETYVGDIVIKQKYKSFYYYSNEKEIFDHKEKDDEPQKDLILYGEEYFEKEYYKKHNECINPKKLINMNDQYYYKDHLMINKINDDCGCYDLNYELHRNQKNRTGLNGKKYNNLHNYYLNEYPTEYTPYIQMQAQIQKCHTKKEEEEEKNNSIKNDKYPITYKRIYYHNEKNTKRKLKTKTGKVENVEIKLEHVSKSIILENEKNKNHTKIEEYDIEVMYINGKLDNKDEKNKINYKETNIYKYEEKEKVGKVHRIFTADEHHFDIYEITKIINPDGTSTVNRHLKESNKIERYNE